MAEHINPNEAEWSTQKKRELIGGLFEQIRENLPEAVSENMLSEAISMISIEELKPPPGVAEKFNIRPIALYSQSENRIGLYSEFFNCPEEKQRHILLHEMGHMVMDGLSNEDLEEFSALLREVDPSLESDYIKHCRDRAKLGKIDEKALIQEQFAELFVTYAAAGGNKENMLTYQLSQIEDCGEMIIGLEGLENEEMLRDAVESEEIDDRLKSLLKIKGFFDSKMSKIKEGEGNPDMTMDIYEDLSLGDSKHLSEYVTAQKRLISKGGQPIGLWSFLYNTFFRVQS